MSGFLNPSEDVVLVPGLEHVSQEALFSEVLDLINVVSDIVDESKQTITILRR